MSCLARSNFRGTCVPSCGVVGLPAFPHFIVSTSSRCSGGSRIQVPLRPFFLVAPLFSRQVHPPGIPAVHSCIPPIRFRIQSLYLVFYDAPCISRLWRCLRRSPRRASRSSTLSCPAAQSFSLGRGSSFSLPGTPAARSTCTMHSYFTSRLVTSFFIPDQVDLDVSLLAVASAAVPSGTSVARRT